MAKSKRKIYRTQRERGVIETAKYLKRIGVLSPKTKLHGGKFVSRHALKKVREFGFARDLGYTTVPVTRKTVAKGVNPRDLIEEEKAKGFIVVRGNRVLIPNDRRYKKAIHEGKAAGVKPVRLGTLEIVPIPYDYFDLVRAMASPDDFDRLKNPGEVFAFSFFGNMGYGAFETAGGPDGLFDQLQRYLPKLKKYFDREGVIRKDDADEPEGLHIVRMNPADVRNFILGHEARSRLARRGLRMANGKIVPREKPEPRTERRKRKTRSRENLPPAKANRLRRTDAERKREKYASMTEAQRVIYNAKQREKMKRYRARLKEEEKRGK